ncbi:MAG: TIGR04283 family arsenosugar biosynthesis glycosyltransferase [Halieaceae bacterium]
MSFSQQAPPLISLIIPVLNEAARLPVLLASLQSWRELAEIIVVDGGSDDDSLSLAQQSADIVLQAPCGRAQQMNAGAERASGRYLLFLHADSTVQIEATSFARLLETAPAWGFFRVRLSGSDWRLRIIERSMNWRSRLSSIATGDQGLWIERAYWQRVGGFKALALMEDVEICTRLRKLAPPLVVAEPLTTSSRRWEARGILRTVVLMWYLRLRYWLGADPEHLARLYRG